MKLDINFGKKHKVVKIVCHINDANVLEYRQKALRI